MNILKRIKNILLACRIILITMNAFVILFSLYFAISRKDLSFKQLSIGLPALLTLSVTSILLSAFGIGIAAYNGKKKKKRHYRLAFIYAILLTLMYVNSAIIAAIFVRDINITDIIFTVIVVIFATIQSIVSFIYAYILKKTRTLKRLNLI